MRVDAHHHLWRYDPVDYDWIDASMLPLRQDFLLPELIHETAAAHIDATVAVQARQTLEETHWLLDLAAQSALIRGVVGWAPIASPTFPETLAQLTANPLLKGLRHVVQAEPAGFLDDPAFNAGIAALAPTGLVYDILIFARQLAEASRFVDRHPNQTFVLDHIAKPDIRHNDFAPWTSALTELARRPNVFCKLSGLVTEADWATWTPDQLRPYLDHTLEAFTPARLMLGSDWPVLTLASTYTDWFASLEAWLTPLTAAERSLIQGETAARVYQLQP